MADRPRPDVKLFNGTVVSGEVYRRVTNKYPDKYPQRDEPLQPYRVCPVCFTELRPKQKTCSSRCRMALSRSRKAPKREVESSNPRLLPTRKAWNKGIKTGRAAYAIGHVIVPLWTKRSTPKKTY